MEITFQPCNSTPLPRILENQRHNRALGLPLVGERGPVPEKLAVVGGSPDVTDYLDELRGWVGDIWAINGTYGWLKRYGVVSTFYAIDPSPKAVEYGRGVEAAIIADTVDPAMLDLFSPGAHVELALLGDGGIPHGVTAAITAFSIAALRGHKHVTYFGCASGFGVGSTHVNKDDGAKHGVLTVRCGGEDYFTRPDLIMQADAFLEMHRACGEFIAFRGTGFLPALLKHGKREVISMDAETFKSLCDQNPHLRDALEAA